MNFYFVKPSCTATAQATRFETKQKAPLRMLCVLVLLCFAKATLVCFAQLNYFVKPSCTATAHATDFSHQKRHSFECLLCHGAICLRKSIIR